MPKNNLFQDMVKMKREAEGVRSVVKEKSRAELKPRTRKIEQLPQIEVKPLSG